MHEEIQTARLAYCQQLFTLSGWDETRDHWLSDKDGTYKVRGGPWYTIYPPIPAYDLPYLLRKLPKSATVLFWGRGYPASPCLLYSGSQWVAFYQSEMTGEQTDDQVLTQFADTPEDALCLLAIALCQQAAIFATFSQK